MTYNPVDVPPYQLQDLISNISDGQTALLPWFVTYAHPWVGFESSDTSPAFQVRCAQALGVFL